MFADPLCDELVQGENVWHGGRCWWPLRDLCINRVSPKTPNFARQHRCSLEVTRAVITPPGRAGPDYIHHWQLLRIEPYVDYQVSIVADLSTRSDAQSSSSTFGPNRTWMADKSCQPPKPIKVSSASTLNLPRFSHLSTCSYSGSSTVRQSQRATFPPCYLRGSPPLSSCLSRCLSPRLIPPVNSMLRPQTHPRY